MVINYWIDHLSERVGGEVKLRYRDNEEEAGGGGENIVVGDEEREICRVSEESCGQHRRLRCGRLQRIHGQW